MIEKGMAAPPEKRSRQTSYNDVAIIPRDIAMGLMGAAIWFGVPFVMALLKNWGVW